MSVKCQVVIDAMEKLAPRFLAQQWDNVGLLVGSPAQNVNKILLALDVTLPVVQTAIEQGADMIIAHHPLIFKPIQHIRTDFPQGQLLAQLLRSEIAVYISHTNLDTASGGVNDKLAELFKLEDVKPLGIDSTEKLLKLAVFVPTTHSDEVYLALMNAGAGHIGNYSHCAFRTEGMGTFLPLAGSEPYLGQAGKLERVHEIKIETVVPERSSRRVIKAMLRAHPYEEVAYDLYPLQNSGKEYGLGRVGRLAQQGITLGQFAACVKAVLEREFVSIVGDLNTPINKVAVCGGSGASLLHKAAFAGADVLVTGDIKYHEAQDALANGLTMIDAGHFATEKPVLAALADYLEPISCEGNWMVEIIQDRVSKDVFQVY